MRNLLIQQRGPKGLMKTWRLRAEQGQASFGSSKHADLRTGDQSIQGIQGLFEFRGDNWVYINFNSETDPETEINKDLSLKFGQTNLQIISFDNRQHVFTDIEKSELAESGHGRKPYQLFTVYHNNVLL